VSLADYLLPDFETPKAPDPKPILALHRGHDGYVTFHRKDPTGDFVNLFSVPGAELDAYFPEFIAELESDSYYSVNAFYRGGYGKNKHHDTLSRPKRSKDSLRWLTACFADLDVYHGNLSAGQVIGTIIDYQDQGILPAASMIVRSGRGVWIFWILSNTVDQYPIGGPVRAWAETVTVYEQIQRELGERLATLESDAEARDVARITRVPGSINGKVGRRVGYWIQTDSNGKGYAYSLANLCKLLNVTPRKLSKYTRADCDPAKREKGLKGFRARATKNIRQFETLRAIRGGFRQGHRARAVWLWGSFLKQSGHDMTLDEIRVEMQSLADECLDETGATPDPLPASEVRDQWRGIADVSNIRNQTIADRLEITPAESELLESWPAATKFQTVKTPEIRASRAEKTELRREFIANHVKRNGNKLPTLDTMKKVLNANGMPASLRTISNDYDSLGLKNPRRKWQADEHQTKLALLD